jgi:hypothetical protein
MWKESVVSDLSYYLSIDVCLKELKRQNLSKGNVGVQTDISRTQVRSVIA